MKTSIYTGKERPGAVLSTILALCILFTMGCKKKDTDPVLPQNPVELTYNLSPNDTIIKKGNNATYRYSSNADSIIVFANGERLEKLPNVNGKIIFSPNQNTYFLWKFYKNGTYKTENVLVTVNDLTVPPPTIFLTSNPSNTDAGGVVIIRIIGAHFNSIVSPEMPEVHDTGSYPVTVNQTTTFHATANGDGGTKTGEVTVVVNPTMTRYQIFTQDQGFQPVIEYRLYPNGFRDTLSGPQIASGGDLFKFCTDGDQRIYEISSGNLIGFAPWIFLENETKVQVGYTNQSTQPQLFTIESAVPETIVMSIQENSYGGSNGSTLTATYVYARYGKKK